MAKKLSKEEQELYLNMLQKKKYTLSAGFGKLLGTILGLVVSLAIVGFVIFICMLVLLSMGILVQTMWGLLF